jgi:hypothetical protein
MLTPVACRLALLSVALLAAFQTSVQLPSGANHVNAPPSSFQKCDAVLQPYDGAGKTTSVDLPTSICERITNGVAREENQIACIANCSAAGSIRLHSQHGAVGSTLPPAHDISNA